MKKLRNERNFLKELFKYFDLKKYFEYMQDIYNSNIIFGIV